MVGGGGVVNLVNLTPHDVRIRCTDGTYRTVRPSGTVASVYSHQEALGEICGMELQAIRRQEVQNLPDPKPGTIYIVSRYTMAYAEGRLDLVSPGWPIKDDRDRVIACHGLCIDLT